MSGYSQNFLEMLSKELAVDIPALQAVLEIESDGQSFLPIPTLTPKGVDVSGYPVIQFEGHVFWSELTSLHDPDLRPASVLAKNPDYRDILYPKATLRYTLRSPAEWDQLLKARSIHADAANRSASWGAFQVMGFNHAKVGFPSLADFLETVKTAEGQARVFIGYVKAFPACLKALRSHDWAVFAFHYNGAGYKKNAYDTKLAKKYKEFSSCVHP
jgi:hypothetical protein